MISRDALKTFAQGALGAMTFGGYAQFQNQLNMELNNKLQDQKNKYEIQLQDQKRKEDVDRLSRVIERQEQQLAQQGRVIEELLNKSQKGWLGW